jgi:D-amino peptidase
MIRSARLLVAVAVCFCVPGAFAQTPRPLKVFISVDMEGVAGAVSAGDVSANGADYPRFREIMTAEANAAIDGAFRAGATEIVVRDSHGNKQNLLPDKLDARARLLRGATTGPKNMMLGIDSTFGAVVFIGYHAKAGTPNAIMAHTSNGNTVDISINGVSLPEGGYNALVAGLYAVPVVFIAGDRAVVEQVRALVGNVEAVAVKEAVEEGSLGMSPQRAQEAIRRGVEQGVRNRAQAKPYRLRLPYTMVLRVKEERPLYPGAQRSGDKESTFTSSDLLQVLAAFNAMK